MSVNMPHIVGIMAPYIPKAISMAKAKISNKGQVKSARDVREIFHDAAMRKPADWETIRNETESSVAQQVASESVMRMEKI